jgi:hypothetical protein
MSQLVLVKNKSALSFVNLKGKIELPFCPLNVVFPLVRGVSSPLSAHPLFLAFMSLSLTLTLPFVHSFWVITAPLELLIVGHEQEKTSQSLLLGRWFWPDLCFFNISGE